MHAIDGGAMVANFAIGSEAVGGTGSLELEPSVGVMASLVVILQRFAVQLDRSPMGTH